jgi:hypothetical protein
MSNVNNQEDINEVHKVVAKVIKEQTPAQAERVEIVRAISEMSTEEINRELAAKELQLKRLELMEREANLEDIRERLADRKLKRKSQGDVFRGHGQNLKQGAINRVAKQTICNHRKGGDGANGVIGGQGDDMQYAILRHIMGNGDIWIRCLRCGKTWKRPLLNGRTEAEMKASAEWAEYDLMLRAQTRNHTSGTHTFQWGVVQNAETGKLEGGPEFYREKMKSVTLE